MSARSNRSRILIALALLILLIAIALIAWPTEPPPPAAAPPTLPPTTQPAPQPANNLSQQMALGNPSGAQANPNQPDNYLIVRDDYALSYHRDRGIPNWVSWHLDAQNLGDVPRYTGRFITDTSLPNGWYQVSHDDYTGSGYDRGHMAPSADRSANVKANQSTFILTNIVPQSPANNQGLWADLEQHGRDLVKEGNEIYLVAGSTGSLGTLANGRLTIPANIWKVMLILPAAAGDDRARISAKTEVIAIWTPNDESVANRSWQEYQTSIRCIEQRTGLDLFAAVDDAVEPLLEGEGCATTVQPSTNSAQPLAPSFNGCRSEAHAATAPDDPVRISSIDKVAETVTLENVSATSVDLDGWIICSFRGSQEYRLSGRLAPGEQRDFPGPGKQIWSNSERDDGALYTPQGELISYWSDE